MLTLLSKDLKLLFGKKGTKKDKALYFLFFFFFLAFLIALESLFYSLILKRISSFDNASLAFTSLFLFVISLLLILSALLEEKRLFYSESDTRQLFAYPLSNAKIILSKILLLFFTQYLLGLVLTYPIFVSYGIIFNRTPFFFFLALFYPALTFFFETGVSMILLFPFKKIVDFLHDHLLIEFIVATLLFGGFAYLYGQVLLVFLNLISENSLSTLFSKEAIAALLNAKKYFIIVTYLADLYFLGRFDGLIFALLFSVFAFALGLALTCFIYSKSLEEDKQKIVKVKKHEYKKISAESALFKKEILLLFRNGDNLFSYSSLLIIAPYLLYLIILALNTIFTSGTVGYYVAALPDFVANVDIAVISLFTLALASGSSDFLGREKNSLKIMKSIPVSPKRMIFIKLFIPFLASFLSLSISILVLRLSSTVDAYIALTSLFFGALALVSFYLLSFLNELKGKPFRCKALLASYIALPFLVFGLMTGLRLADFDRLYVALIASLAEVALTALIVIYFLKKEDSLWLSLEVSA